MKSRILSTIAAVLACLLAWLIEPHILDNVPQKLGDVFKLGWASETVRQQGQGIHFVAPFSSSRESWCFENRRKLESLLLLNFNHSQSNNNPSKALAKSPMIVRGWILFTYVLRIASGINSSYFWMIDGSNDHMRMVIEWEFGKIYLSKQIMFRGADWSSWQSWVWFGSLWLHKVGGSLMVTYSGYTVHGI